MSQLEAPWIPEVAGTTDLTFFQPDGTRSVDPWSCCGALVAERCRGWCADGQHITDKEDGDEYVGDGAWFDSF